MLISKRRIGILKNYLNKMKIVRVCDPNIFEIPILTVEIIYVADHTTVKIGISKHKLTLSSSCLGSFSGSLFLKLTIFYIYSCKYER